MNIFCCLVRGTRTRKQNTELQVQSSSPAATEKAAETCQQKILCDLASPQDLVEDAEFRRRERAAGQRQRGSDHEAPEGGTG